MWRVRRWERGKGFKDKGGGKDSGLKGARLKVTGRREGEGEVCFLKVGQ